MTEQQYRVIADKDSTPDLVSTHAAPGDRLVYDVIDADRWSLVRIEHPVEGTEPSVQPPTREQIATAVRPVISRWYDTGGNLQERIADAVLALFSQPTPSAVPERTYTAADVQEAFERGCIRGEQDADERNWSRRQYEKMQAPLPPAEPVSIADMAPGTTFTAGHPDTGRPANFERCDDEQHAPHTVFDMGGGAFWKARAFDPSTIRDVTPPKGDDRG
jgi:hypothetical protein